MSFYCVPNVFPGEATERCENITGSMKSLGKCQSGRYFKSLWIALMYHDVSLSGPVQVLITWWSFPSLISIDSPWIVFKNWHEQMNYAANWCQVWISLKLIEYVLPATSVAPHVPWSCLCLTFSVSCPSISHPGILRSQCHLLTAMFDLFQLELCHMNGLSTEV